MDIFNISINNQQIVPSACTMYAVAGEVNYHAVQFSYDERWSDAAFKLVAFTGSNTTIVLEDEGEPIPIPWEVLSTPGYVHIGVIGYDNAGRQVITTAESIGHRSDIVVRPESLSDEVPEDPTPSIWQQILMQMGDLSELDTEDKSTLVAAINEAFYHSGGGTSDHTLLTNRDAANQHPMSAITGLENALDDIDTELRDLSDSVDGLSDDLSDVEFDIQTINDKMPSSASSTNKLADKDFVNSTVGTNTAYYISNNGEPFNSLAELQAYSGTVTNNDYAFVKGTDSAGNVTYTRYKYNSSTLSWAAEYVLNNSSFTASQWNTINSGITEQDKTVWDNKQPKTIDDTGGYFETDTVEGALQQLGGELDGVDDALDGILTLIGGGDA